MFGGEQRLSASTAALIECLGWPEIDQWRGVNESCWFVRRRNRSRGGQQQQCDQDVQA